ncbi:MAG: hypothetical protein LBC02_09150 [Planctomycetaceae bacterium]|nr:hypothetical protein [Planctomycetaceae bacterium]
MVPYTIGVLFSLVLREMYRRKLWEKENMAEEELETPQENVVVKLYDPSLDEEISEETSNDEMSPEIDQDKKFDVVESNVVESNVAESGVTEDATVLGSEPNTEPDATPTSPEVIPPEMPEISEMISVSELQSPQDGFQPELTTKPKEMEPNLSSVFDNQKVLADTFRIDDILEEMVTEDPPIIPADLSLRLEEDGKPEKQINQMEKENNDDDWLEPDENEILAKIANPADADSNNLSFLQPDVPFDQTENNKENLDAIHSDISPMAIELLGEDFNFNSFFEEKLKPKQDREESTVVSEISPGIYQADGGFINVANKQVMHELLPKEQEVVSLYPDHLIQNAVIEPDSSETTQNLSFTEESLPMFVRKKNRK